MNSERPIVGAPLVRVDFKTATPPTLRKERGYHHLGGGDYIDRRTGHHYENVRLNGRYTWRKLSALTHAASLKEIRKKRSDHELSKRGLAEDPYRRIEGKTVADLARLYLVKNCPRRNAAEQRSPADLVAEKKRVETLLKWPGLQKAPAQFTLRDCPDYHAFRIGQIAAKRLSQAGGDPSKIRDQREGHRQVDKELVTLSNIFRCAIRHADQTGITINPIGQDRQRFRNSKLIKHCRDHMPADANELHRIADILFDSRRSEALGWQLLFSSLIGQRAAEILRLRLDAANEFQPGHISKNCLYLYRSNSSKGTYPYAEITVPLWQCLEAHRAWHQLRYPAGIDRVPWYFPSPENPKKPVSPGALTHALERVTAELGLPHRTSHGCGRAYFVNVLRTNRKADGSHRYQDDEIARRIGQRSQGKLIVDVYGDCPPYQMKWLPEGRSPAWTRWLPSAPIPSEQLTLGI